MSNDFPRRNRIDRFSPAEMAIWRAKQAVEAAGAHVFLTDATNLLSKAMEKVADYVDLGEPEFDFTALSREKDGGLAAEAVDLLRGRGIRGETRGQANGPVYNPMQYSQDTAEAFLRKQD